MNGIAIYIEGGGDTASGKAQLRQGFDALLARQKNAARARRLSWRLVLCGGRNATFDAFQHVARRPRDELVGLLVDAEDPVASATPAGRSAHLAKRDHWDLSDVTAEHVHLMTLCMESWRLELDQEPKASVYKALVDATKATRKGEYGKIKHASALLGCVSPQAIATRCASFRQFTEWLDAAIARA